MKVNLKEIAKLWAYVVLMLVGLLACGLLYVHYGEWAGSLMLSIIYIVGAAFSYLNGTSPEVSDALSQRVHIGGSLLWFVLLTVTACAATLCYMWFNSTQSEASCDITDVI